MQSIAGLVLMPHKTIETSCSISSAAPTDVKAGEKNVSPSKSTEATVKEGIVCQQLKQSIEYAYGRERPWHLTRVHTSYFILNYNQHYA